MDVHFGFLFSSRAQDLYRSKEFFEFFYQLNLQLENMLGTYLTPEFMQNSQNAR